MVGGNKIIGHLNHLQTNIKYQRNRISVKLKPRKGTA